MTIPYVENNARQSPSVEEAVSSDAVPKASNDIALESDLRRNPSGANEGSQTLHDSDENRCPFLSDVPVDRLPPRFRRLLMANDDDDDASVAYHPGHIPAPPWCCLFLAVPFVLGLAGMIYGAAVQRAGRTPSLGELLCAVAFALALVAVGAAARRNRTRRTPLFAKNADGTRKPWPGCWKAGTYLMGNEALMEYDGSRVFLVPVHRIRRIEQVKEGRSGYRRTTVFFTPPEEDREQRLDLNLEDSYQAGLVIRGWMDRATGTNA